MARDALQRCLHTLSKDWKNKCFKHRLLNGTIAIYYKLSTIATHKNATDFWIRESGPQIRKSIPSGNSRAKMNFQLGLRSFPFPARDSEIIPQWFRDTICVEKCQEPRATHTETHWNGLIWWQLQVEMRTFSFSLSRFRSLLSSPALTWWFRGTRRDAPTWMAGGTHIRRVCPFRNLIILQTPNYKIW